MPRLSEDQWRTVLDLSSTAADLTAEARLRFLESSGAPAAIVQEVLAFLAGAGSATEIPNRIGTSIDRFVVTAYCGGGGAGDVYQATDTELHRPVALKFLHPAVLEQSGAVDRFIREARTISALNHPNIVTVHEVIRPGNDLAIVMEFVDGTPLRELCGSPLPLPEVLSIGRQFAAALAAAHESGIVHRDIKPENAIRRPNGVVKVLDFGLATTLSVRPDGEPALSISHLFGGTWRYMSPEQFRGETTTPASDVYSLGLVLCELASGQLPRSEPPISFLKGTLKTGTGPGVPPELRQSSSVDWRRASVPCALSSSQSEPGPHSLPDFGKLHKSVRPLFRSMLAQSPAQRPTAAAVAERLSALESPFTAGRPSRWSRLLLGGAIAALAGLIVLAGYLLLEVRPAPAMLASPLSVEPGYRWSLTFSPNGDHLAYAWDREGAPRQIYLQNIDPETGKASPPARLTQDPGREDLPAWSPDGKTIAFNRDAHGVSKLILRNVATGRERAIPGVAGRSLTWTRDGSSLLASVGPYLTHQISLISPVTGEQHPLTSSDGEINDDNPTPSPDDRSVTFARYFSDSLSRLATVPLNKNGSSLAQPVFFFWPSFSARVSRYPVYSGNGRDLFFIAETGGIDRVWRSHNGEAPSLLASLGERITALAVPVHRNRLAFLRNVDDTNIWKIELPAAGPLAAGRTSRVIATSRFDHRPAVSPDGSQLAFESNRGGYYEIWIAKLATGEAWQLTDFKTQCGSPRWSPDGGWIVFDARVKTSSSVFKMRSTGGRAERLTWNVAFSDILPVFSPDSRWIYFASNRSGRYQIWRIPAEGGPASVQTDAEATVPELSRDGRMLFYLDKFWVPSRLWEKDLSTGRVALVAENVFYRGFTVGRNVVYFAQPDRRGNLNLVARFDSGKRVRTVSPLSPNIVGGFSLSPDEKSLYYAEFDSSGDELLMVNDY